MSVTKASGDTAPRQAVRSFPPDPVADAYRRWGYLHADLDPMGRIAPFEHQDITDVTPGADDAELERLRRAYCGSLGFEFMHIVERDRADWLKHAIEQNGKGSVDERWILERIMEAELFERFLHSRYVGAKRFSIDGVAGLIPLLDSVLDTAGNEGADFLYIAMSHRGRLNVMKNIVRVPGESVFASMEDVDPRSVLGSGDVKYHTGATGRYVTHSDKVIEVHLATNPSHLEAVDAVVMGRTRARQERWGTDGQRRMLPVTLHGDAAFAGQGIASETLNFADMEHYSVGGTVHVIVNNLVGFTAEPKALHSGAFSSDAAKRLSIPIIHVNGEDPVAIWRAGRIATSYRNRFQSDVVIDLIGFRRFGHSEVEDPTTTQPLLYEKIKAHPMLWQIYGERIGVASDELERMEKSVMDGLSRGQEKGRGQSKRPKFFKLPEFWGRFHGGRHDERFEVDTAVPLPRLEELAQRIVALPDGFNTHPKIEKLLRQRAEMVEGKRGVDWGMAEALAFASLLHSGHRVRLTGQDSRRGTFNHRHAAVMDTKTGKDYLPLQHISKDQGDFAAVDSPLSEAAALGFEYGFSRECPDGLVLWEAQFGDFVNGAQIIIDQFVTAAEDKWKLLSGLVLLLPHGYEGQGPEHSSARIERFLQLAAQDNMQVCQPSVAGQYFHLLRRQVLRSWRKPLVLFMPKSVLRAEPACSDIGTFAEGRFQPVLGDTEELDATGVILCTGKITHELRAAREKLGVRDRAIISIEQLYPFPEKEIAEALKRYPRLNKILWVQEEPANMGALSFVKPLLKPIVGDRHITTIKRYESASPATGSAKAHVLEQKALVKLAFA